MLLCELQRDFWPWDKVSWAVPPGSTLYSELCKWQNSSSGIYITSSMNLCPELVALTEQARACYHKPCQRPGDATAVMFLFVFCQWRILKRMLRKRRSLSISSCISSSPLSPSLCRLIRSVCEVCGQASSRSWCFWGTETPSAAASRTRSRRWGTWSTPPATSHWDIPCTCHSQLGGYIFLSDE